MRLLSCIFNAFSGISQFTQKNSIFIVICIITMVLMKISITHGRMSIIKIETVYSSSDIYNIFFSSVFFSFFRIANIYARERLRFKQKTFKICEKISHFPENDTEQMERLGRISIACIFIYLLREKKPVKTVKFKR